MTTRTRNFVVVSLLVLVAGLGTALAGYYLGFPMSALQRRGGPDELRFVPRDSSLVAYADVHALMTSDVRRRFHDAMAGRMRENGQQEFAERTGIDIEQDVDRVVACLVGTPGQRHSGLVLARGRFDEAKVEQLMRDHGAQTEQYQGRRVVVAQAPTGAISSAHPESFAVAFVESGLAAIGSTPLVRRAIDLHAGATDSALINDELMGHIRSLDAGNAWAVGRFDALRSSGRLPPPLETQLSLITWFSASGHVNSGIQGVVRAETRDEESANNLREVIRGFVALARMQAGAKPELQSVVQSLDLGGTGKDVALSFDVPSQVIDLLGKSAAPAQP
jgi:hypothetical protein